MKKVLLAAVLMGLTLTACNENKQTTNEEGMNTTLQLTQEWDKVFPQSDKVTHEKVTFKNRYFGITAYENMTGAKVDLQGQDANLQPLNKPLAEPFVVTHGNKQLYIVPGATHCDLYDGGEQNYIPFDKLAAFYNNNMK